LGPGDVTPKIHRHFVETARRVSPPLERAVVRIGRVAMPQRNGRGLAQFLARVVVGQQLSTSAARSIWARVETAVRDGGGSMPAYFRGRNARTLRRCGMSKAKIRALMAIRQAEAAGLLSTVRLRRMTHAERSEHLRTIWGVGQWTADMASIFYFGDPDVWPEGDAGVNRGLEMIVGLRSKRTLLKVANAFSPYRSFLALYMWRVLEEPKPARAPTSSRQPL
jgi:DNA-3-methyladenine glycosylase II